MPLLSQGPLGPPLFCLSIKWLTSKSQITAGSEMASSALVITFTLQGAGEKKKLRKKGAGDMKQLFFLRKVT